MKELVQMRHVLSERTNQMLGISKHTLRFSNHECSWNIHSIWQIAQELSRISYAIYESTAELHTALSESPQIYKLVMSLKLACTHEDEKT